MFKLQKMIGGAINRFFEWTWQRKANKQFQKHSVIYKDGDNT